MTTLQEFKSLAIPGAKCVFQAKWCPRPTLRTVVEARSQFVSFTHPTRDAASRLEYPKATEISQPKPGLFIITATDNKIDPLAYDFRPESIATVEAHACAAQAA